MKLKRWIPIVLGILLIGNSSCRRSPDANQPIGDSHTASPSSVSDSLKLKPGMQIKLSQPTRTLNIGNPSNAEGLSFTWGSSDIHGSEGKMTLANVMNSRRMTLPIFWPEGELFLSNSSAIWMSDIAFEELKKNRQTEWRSGVLDNALLGPIEDLPLLKKELEALNSSLAKSPEKLKEASELKSERKLGKFLLKINGVEQEVEVLNAKNWLAHYQILNNAQNPLILQINFLPSASVGDTLFSPLTLLKGLLEYRVEEINLP